MPGNDPVPAARFSDWEGWLRAREGRFRTRWSAGNRIEILAGAKEFIPRMLASISGSRRSVAYQFFGIEADAGGIPFGSALIDAAKRGVTTNVILDSVELFLRTNGRWSFFPVGRPAEVTRERRDTQELLRAMEGAGVGLFRYGWKYLLNRNHSKSLVVDDEFLFVGGFNPTEHNSVWHEICAAVTGPIVADGLDQFNEVFRWSGQEPIPARVTDSNDRSSAGIEVTAGLLTNVPRQGRFELTDFLLEAIGAARTSIRIENGYVGHRRIFEQLIEAKKRGVETVQIVAPAKSNHSSVDRLLRKWAPLLLKHGVEIYLYPRMTHAKLMLVDDLLVTIGSANFESFSLRMNNELNLVALDPTGALAAEVLVRVFQPDMAESEPVRS
ncbi:MAG: phosphatidylserine/phosphatidylglycerophosphate/cardiolipin synthase family protein [Pseudomonadota bacterium]